MNVGEKVLVEATVAQVGADMITVTLDGAQRVIHARVKRSEVRRKPGRK